jgi:hypothetical protein
MSNDRTDITTNGQRSSVDHQSRDFSLERVSYEFNMCNVLNAIAVSFNKYTMNYANIWIIVEKYIFLFDMNIPKFPMIFKINPEILGKIPNSGSPDLTVTHTFQVTEHCRSRAAAHQQPTPTDVKWLLAYCPLHLLLCHRSATHTSINTHCLKLHQ